MKGLLFLIFMVLFSFSLQNLSLGAAVYSSLQSKEVSELNLNSALQEKKNFIDQLRRGENREPFYVVLGNQSADMDSVVSAIILAHIRGPSVLSLINIPKEDLDLRKDVDYLFNKLGVDRDALLYREDFPLLIDYAKQGLTRIILVDHNILPVDQTALEPYVEEIFDHHQDENVPYLLLAPEKKHLLVTGSNASLIAKEIFETKQKALTEEVSYLLLAPILLDTDNLKDRNKTTRLDRFMAKRLKKLAGKLYTSDYYEILLERKLYVDPTRPDQILRKDFKTYQEGKLAYGISSLPASVEWSEKNRINWEGAVRIFLEQQAVNLWMGLEHMDDGMHLILYTPSKKLQEALVEHIRLSEALNQRLQLKSCDSQGFLFYEIEGKIARKQLQPLFLFEESLLIQEALNHSSNN